MYSEFLMDILPIVTGAFLALTHTKISDFKKLKY